MFEVEMGREMTGDQQQVQREARAYAPQYECEVNLLELCRTHAARLTHDGRKRDKRRENEPRWGSGVTVG